MASSSSASSSRPRIRKKRLREVPRPINYKDGPRTVTNIISKDDADKSQGHLSFSRSYQPTDPREGNQWSKKLKMMEFYTKQSNMNFVHVDGNPNGIMCELEVHENTIDRGLIALNADLARYPNSIPVQTGSDSYKILIRNFAMQHVLKCLQQGETNEQYIQQQCDDKSCYRQETFQDTSNGTPSHTSTRSIEHNFWDDKQTSANESTTVGVKDVNWMVYSELLPAGWGLSREDRLAFSSVPIDPRDNSFLHPAVSCLDPTHPSEPFLMFGIGVRCVDMKDIFALDRCHSIYTNDVAVDSEVLELFSFMQGIYDVWCEENKRESRELHFVERLIKCLQNILAKDPDLWNKKMEKFEKTATQMIKAFLILLTTWAKNEPYECEMNLQIIAWHLLCLGSDGCGRMDGPIAMELFTKNPIQSPLTTSKKREGPLCFTDVVYVSFKKPSPLPVRVEAKILERLMCNQSEIVRVNTGAVWQTFEQVLAALLKGSEPRFHQGVVYKTGLLLVDSKVRTLVLSMPIEVFKELKTFKSVQETLHYFRSYPGVTWCTLYVEKDVYPIWDILRLAKIATSNFN